MNLDVFTSPAQACSEILERRKNTELLSAVYTFLDGDIPEHFSQESPISYLCRHVATPNYETLRFVELAQTFAFPMVIGQDLDDIFVSNNVLKLALGKLPVTKGVTRTGEEIIENFTVVDFATAQGEPLRNITTFRGTTLPQFHLNLFRNIYPERVSVIDESDWINRHSRGDIKKHYVRLLSLLVAHGVMFEFYEDSEIDFVHEILNPAFTEVTERFGHRPLITNLVDDSLAYARNWNSYPSVVYQFVKAEAAKSCARPQKIFTSGATL
jgi:hypothetical protein